MSQISTIASPSRRIDPTPARLEDHIRTTSKRFAALGISCGDSVASLLPEGPDAATAQIALGPFSPASLIPLPALPSCDHYVCQLAAMDAKLLLMHPAEHPARYAAQALNIRVANVLRHFEAGVFTLEAAVNSGHTPPTAPAWKLNRGMPLVLIAPGLAYRSLSARLDPNHPVIGITPPSLEHLPPPHTIEHIAAESVRMLRRYRPQGPYALAGWRADALVALEMARLLDEEGEKVPFVAMLDASEFFRAPAGRIRRAFASLLRRKSAPGCEFMAEALRQYRPRPWYGKMIHISPSDSDPANRVAWFEWNHVAPQGLISYDAPAEMQAVAQILDSELAQATS
jgi:hypothetical protein